MKAVDVLKTNLENGMPYMVFNPRCRGVISELGGATNPFDDQVHVYSWKTDREGNTIGKTPRDAFNHGVKAITYGLVINFGYARASLSSKIISVKRW